MCKTRHLSGLRKDGYDQEAGLQGTAGGCDQKLLEGLEPVTWTVKSNFVLHLASVLCLAFWVTVFPGMFQSGSRGRWKGSHMESVVSPVGPESSQRNQSPGNFDQPS